MRQHMDHIDFRAPDGNSGFHDRAGPDGTLCEPIGAGKAGARPDGKRFAAARRGAALERVHVERDQSAASE